ncbi:MAG: hypothetical protein FWH52_03060 [Synergistaceae bacterium]|nr:hypothetical protein [Synergistaceae bacterium]
MKLSRFFILLTLFTLALSILSFFAMHFKSNDDVSLSLFELPRNLPYLYCEFNGLTKTNGSNENFVLLAFWQNEKMHKITGTAVNDEEWDFRAFTPEAQQVVDRVNMMHVRKARVVPNPKDRDVKGRIIASDAGLISRITHAPMTPVYLEAELSIFDDEYVMNFDIYNIESVIPAAWLSDLNPINIENIPFVEGFAYANFFSNITLIELFPQFQMFINKNAKNRNIASSLRSMKGALYASIGSESALWDGISIPAILLKFNLRNNTMKKTLYDFVHDLFSSKYELNYSDNEYSSTTPSSVWLRESRDFLEIGVIDKRSTVKNGVILPRPPKEALLWLSFSPHHLAEAINNSIIQISPDLDCKETLAGLDKIDNCTLTLFSIKSGVFKWKALSTEK